MKSKNCAPNTRQIHAVNQAQSIPQNAISSIKQVTTCENNLRLPSNLEMNRDEQMPEKSTRLEVSQCIEGNSKETPNTTEDDSKEIPNMTEDHRVVQPERLENNSHIENPHNTDETDDFVEDSLTICDDNFVTRNYEADNSSRFAL